MALKYYYDLMSQPCRALYIFLKQTNIPFEPKIVALRKGEHFTEDFEVINPMKKVPVIIHNNFRLTESVAILRYLAREYKTPDHWYPKDSIAQAKIDEYLEWQHLNLRTYGSLVFMHKFLFPLTKQRPVNQEKVDYYLSELDKTLVNMEKMFLSDTKFINQNEISIADLLATCELEQPQMVGFDVLAGKPKLQEWVNRVQSLVTPHYEEAHEHSNRLKEKMRSSSNL